MAEGGEPVDTGATPTDPPPTSTSSSTDEPTVKSPVREDDPKGSELENDGSVEEEEGWDQEYERVKDKPCRVTELEVKGFQRTKPDVVGRELEEVRNATNLDEVKDELVKVIEAFEEMEVFKEIDVSLVEPLEDTPESCRVEFLVEEWPIFHGKASTFVQRNQGGVEGYLGIRNYFGRAERFRLSAECGSERSTEYALEYFKPRVKGLPWSFDTRIFNNHHSCLTYSSFVEKLRGVSVGLRSSGGMHSLRYELGWQHIIDPTNLASQPIQNQLGHKLRSAVSYTFLYNEIHPMIARPQSGFAARWHSELGGLHPSSQVSKYMKHRGDAEVAWPILPWASVSLSVAAGVMLPVGEGYMNKTTNISDRFFLGGIDSLRGFKYRGCGPSAPCRTVPDEEGRRRPEQQRRDTLGGDLLSALTCSLNFDLPGTAFKYAGIYGHVFCNVGNTMPLTGTNLSLKQSIRDFSSTYRSSAGLGLVWPTGWGTLEVNYVLPITHSPHDRLHQGLQLGFAAKVFHS
ncbi:hypothetical protein BSKO_07101 [Bryopsis sp. KO-2023]|nr:hypothetical protein BSKO_07101 [Bryopsis sp. KO-2023]